jgi:hypothetical protein
VLRIGVAGTENKKGRQKPAREVDANERRAIGQV